MCPLADSSSGSSSSREPSSSDSLTLSSGDKSLTSSSSEQQDVDAVGAYLKVEQVDRGFLHGSHRVVVVDSDVTSGSLLERVGLQKGSVVSRLNGKRTRDVQTFVQILKQSEEKGTIDIEYKNSSNRFVTVTMNID